MSSETSAIKSQTTGNYPKRNKLHLQHGESLRTRSIILFCKMFVVFYTVKIVYMCVIMTCFTSYCLCDALMASWNTCVRVCTHMHTYTIRTSSTLRSGGALLEFWTDPLTVHVHCSSDNG